MDGNGCDHHFMPHVDAVVVIDADGETLWRQSLTSRKPIEHWVTHIGSLDWEYLCVKLASRD